MNSHLRLGVFGVAIVLLAVTGEAAAAVRTPLLSVDIGQVRQANRIYAKSMPTMRVSASDPSAKPMDHTRHETILGLDPQSRLVLLKRETRDGVRNYRYQQTFNGLPVLGDHVVVREEASGDITRLYGSRIEGLAAEISPLAPRVTSVRALATAKSAALGFLRNTMQTSGDRVRLVVFIDDDGRAYKAYEVTFEAKARRGGGWMAPSVLVDADTGRVLRMTDTLRHASATGPGGNGQTGKYEYGTSPWGYLDVTQSGSTCTLSNSAVKTVDMGGVSVTNTQVRNKAPYAFTCSRNVAKTINGTYAPVNDAHYFGTKAAQMYRDYAGRDIAGGQIALGVNVYFGNGEDNAYANGGTRTVQFGNGTTSTYTMGTIDGVGHEMSHIFTSENGQMTYESGGYTTQGGSMDEAFSDMAAEALNYYLRGSNDFLFWNDSSRSNTASRSLCSPSLPYYGNASQWTTKEEWAHYGATIYGKAFCLLSKTTGWNTKKAFQVFADANANSWTPTSNFNTGACGVEDAATARGFVKADVTAAFKAVGVACPTTGGGTLLNVALPQVATGQYSSTYSVTIPTGKTQLVVTLSGGTGDADLYVRKGATPTTSTFDCRSYNDGNVETCTLNNPTVGGTYYIRVYAYAAFSGVTLQAK